MKNSTPTSKIGFISSENETYKKHEKVLLSCLDAKVSLPKETVEYFGTNCLARYFIEDKLEIEIPSKEWLSEDNFKIKIEDLSEGICSMENNIVNVYLWLGNILFKLGWVLAVGLVLFNVIRAIF